MTDLFLLIGLPGAGKTTRAKQLAARHNALRMTPDEWMIPLFGAAEVDNKRDIVEARMIRLAWDALRIGTNVVLDFGCWGRDERTAIRHLTASAGGTCHLVYLPIDHETQVARIAHRQATRPHETVPISEDDIREWRAAFEEPAEDELSDGIRDAAPEGSVSWFEWAARRWPTLAHLPADGTVDTDGAGNTKGPGRI